MAQMIWATIKGATQGEIKSDIVRKTFEGKIEILSYDDGVAVPYESSSGHISGHRLHNGVTITKQLDKTSPLLSQVVFTNENLPTVKFEFYRPTPTLGGTVGEKVFFTIELENANIVSLTRSMSGDTRTETLELVYEKITITYVEGGVTATDDWTSGLNHQG